jgi:hypothetical protein
MQIEGRETLTKVPRKRCHLESSSWGQGPSASLPSSPAGAAAAMPGDWLWGLEVREWWTREMAGCYITLPLRHYLGSGPRDMVK